ncbi:MAG: peptidoglycan editing factor PgeF [Lachnospiraceae bacterium]
MSIELKYKNQNSIFVEQEKNGVRYLEYPLFTRTGMVKHGFSTRLGGVSQGHYSTMNLSFARADDPIAVRENFHRFCNAIGTTTEHLVCSHQTHTTNVRVVTKEDCGKGYNRPRDYEDVDGLVTNESGVCLATFYADCVPLFFLDTVKHAIGLAHSGWRGTVGKIGEKTVAQMTASYGTNPKDVLAAIGPSICQSCYEVIEEFRKQYKQSQWQELFYKKENGKYQLNLWKANEIVLKETGITQEHTIVTNLCTCCNEQLLFSHRASHGKRGNLGAFLELK